MPPQGRRLPDDPEGSETTQQLVISDLRYVVDRLAVIDSRADATFT